MRATSPRPQDAFRARRRRRLDRPRAGQAMLEVAVGLIVFMVTVMVVFDAAWLFYHQIALTQATKKVARYAGTNLHTRAEITQHLYNSTGPTLISSTNGATTVTITTEANNAAFATLAAANGDPAVTIQVAYDHAFLGPWPWTATGFTVSSSATARISTWPEVPTVSF